MLSIRRWALKHKVPLSFQRLERISRLAYATLFFTAEFGLVSSLSLGMYWSCLLSSITFIVPISLAHPKILVHMMYQEHSFVVFVCNT